MKKLILYYLKHTRSKLIKSLYRQTELNEKIISLQDENINMLKMEIHILEKQLKLSERKNKFC